MANALTNKVKAEYEAITSKPRVVLEELEALHQQRIDIALDMATSICFHHKKYPGHIREFRKVTNRIKEIEECLNG